MSRTRRSPFGWVQIGLMALSVGIALLAAKLLKPKTKAPIADDKPTTLTVPGSYTNWLRGIRKVGPFFAWAGSREKRKEKIPGGKGLTSQKQDVWYEAGWHVLAAGPCDALHSIEQSGAVIFEGPITPHSHPSGTTVDLGDEGVFVIYWGEQTQPVDTFLSDPTRVTIASRWPRATYVLWNKKRLGPTPVWPVLNYELEKRPSGAFLSGSQPWYEPSKVLSGTSHSIVARVANAAPDTGYLEVVGDLTQEFDPGRPAALAGNSLADGDYVVRKTQTVLVVTGTGGTGLDVFETHTRVFLETGTAGSNVAGTLTPYTFARDDGANIAHAIADMLFADWPDGLGLDPDGPEPWDLASLEAWGAEYEADGLRASIISVDGEEASTILANVLQDHSVMLCINPLNQGKLTFQRVREPSGPLANVPDDLYSGNLAERETLIGEKTSDKLTFVFTDRERSYGDSTIAERDDGSISYLEYAHSKQVRLSSTTYFPTAAFLAARRSQEELAGASQFTLNLSRGAREFLPGQAITASGFDDVLRVFEVGVDPLTEEVSVKVASDVYGITTTDFVNSPGGGGPQITDPEPDVFRFLEVPEAIAGEQELIVVPHLRAHAQTIESIVHASRDNTTYTILGKESAAASGGRLDVSMAAAAPYYQAQGPTFTIVGPDVANALDLTGDDVSWSKGRQVCAIVDDQGLELCFVRKITVLSSTQARLDGLLRARYDTRRRAWSAGAEVYVFSNDELTDFSDVLLDPGEDLYVKSQPVASGGLLPIAAVAPIAQVLRGKGLVPVDPEALYVRAPHVGSASYNGAEDVTVAWGWSTSSSTNTGAGYQPAGTAIGAPVIKGTFEVELRTTGGTLVSTQTTTNPFVTFAAATLSAAPINGNSFKFRVRHVNNGFASEFVELTVTKV